MDDLEDTVKRTGRGLCAEIDTLPGDTAFRFNVTINLCIKVIAVAIARSDSQLYEKIVKALGVEINKQMHDHVGGNIIEYELN